MKHIRKFNESESKDEENITYCFTDTFDLAVSYEIFESSVDYLDEEHGEITTDCYDVDIEHEYYGDEISETDFNKYVDILNEIKEAIFKLKEVYNYKIQFTETSNAKITIKIFK